MDEVKAAQDVAANPPVADIPAPQTGNSEDLKAKVEELERRNQGMLRDLQQERERRKALESKASAPSQPGNAGVAPAEVDPVVQFVRSQVVEALTPLQQELEQLKAEKEMQRAFKFVAKAEKLDVDEVPSSNVFREIVNIAQEYGIRGATPEAEAKLAYEIYKKRMDEKQNAEKAKEVARNSAINQQASEAPRGVPGGANQPVQRISRAEIAKMPLSDYRQLMAEAKAKGIQLRVE